MRKGPSAHHNLLISYLTLRKLLGIIGVSFPIILLAGCLILGKCEGIQPSISDYYYTNMRDVFVGYLFAIGLFLFTYTGYDKRDNLAGNLGCLFAIGVAIFPTGHPNTIISQLHLGCAAALFLVLSYFSLFLFTLSSKTDPGGMKRKRNVVYRVCGYIMLFCISFLFLWFLLLAERFPNLAFLDPVFWLETLALWAFGISWLTKGEMLLADAGQAKA